MSLVGAKLARDEGLAIDINVECSTAIASKLCSYTGHPYRSGLFGAAILAAWWCLLLSSVAFFTREEAARVGAPARSPGQLNRWMRV